MAKSPTKKKRRKEETEEPKRKKKKSSPSTSFKEVALEAQFALLPHTLSDIRVVIFQLLQDGMMRYHQQIGGVPISLFDIKLAPGSECGKIQGTDPLIHVDVHLRAHVFAPELNQSLIGRVNKVERTYIGLLVHGLFNASIKKQHLTGCTFSEDRWLSSEKHSINVGTYVVFTLLSFDHAHGILAMDGRLVSVLRHPNEDNGDSKVESS